jgi:phosphoribosylaminoimidazolecarboxamide formyltransferase/IMP cyclohydrolase
MPDLVPIRRALVSVSDKTGLIPFARALVAAGVEIISTGGTATALKAAGIKVTSIDAVTGFPEIMGGRVKTLHPKVHGGLLALRDDPQHQAHAREHAIQPIDLACVNLYPFEQTVLKPDCTEHDAIENIDIGGPSMIRSAAKNFEWVVVATSPTHYERIVEQLRTHHGQTTRTLRAELAADAFALTSRYDAAITTFLRKAPAQEFPPLLSLNYVKIDDLRYGENPHQPAALYRALAKSAHPHGTVASAEQLHGKELSYNNILDANAAQELALALRRVAPDRVGACIVKHTNPCGSALATSASDAVDEAIAGDPLAAYGGILALNAPLDAHAAERLADKNVFLEVILAPSFTPDALAILRAKSANVRLLAAGEPDIVHPNEREIEHRSIPGGLLVQERDLRVTPIDKLEHKAGPKPTHEQLVTATFLEATARSLLSNAIVVGGRSPARPAALRMFGAGAGQMDRMTACRIAIEKSGTLAAHAVAFSDAFFPFPDGPEILINAGVQCLVHPGGSKRDPDTFDLCNARGVTCLVTGTRHFRH